MKYTRSLFLRKTITIIKKKHQPKNRNDTVARARSPTLFTLHLESVRASHCATTELRYNAVSTRPER